MACTLAESPRDPFHRKLRPLRYLCSRFGCYRVERTSSRTGVAPAEVQAPFTAHCFTNHPDNRAAFRLRSCSMHLEIGKGNRSGRLKAIAAGLILIALGFLRLLAGVQVVTHRTGQ